MKILSKSFYLIGLISLSVIISCTKKDELNKELTHKVDSLFQKWDNDYSPGAAVAILKDGELIFKKGYGMANLEYGIPISPSSIFHIASNSKQFVAFCIVLLELEGKLSLNDDIRKFLPELPDFGEKITIKNLIHHTSGLRDQWQLLNISGTRIDDVIKQDHILRLVKNQERLNFEPGSRYLYCNTGYTLLAEIVKKVSGQSLREFAAAKIFQPLGMRNTHFHDNYKEIVKNRTYSYSPKDSISFENSILSYSTVGATSLFTTVEDEAKWLNNYFTTEIGGKDAIDQMYELGITNSGDTLEYAFALRIDTYKGYKRIGHSGSDAGYRSYTIRFPERNLGLIVFSNVSDFNSQLMTMKVADIFLDGSNNDKSLPINRLELSRESKNLLVGKYYNDEGLFFDILDSTKLYVRNRDVIQEMTPVSESVFTIMEGVAILKFCKVENYPLQYYDQSHIYLFQKYQPFELTSEDMKYYQGIFRNDELETQYEIYNRNGHLVLGHNKYEDVSLTPITKNQFSCPHRWMENLIFQRDSRGKITGFEVNSGRVLHLFFRKVV